MNPHRKLRLVAAVVAISLSACNSSSPTDSSYRVELPQQLRLPQNDLVKTFERRSGRIAVVGDDGNVVIMDQAGSAPVKITREGNLPVRQQRQQLVQRQDTKRLRTSYGLPVWSPDGAHIAVVETKSEPPTSSSVMELNPQSVTIQRGDDTVTIEQAESGSPRMTRDPGGSYIETKPARVIIDRSKQGEQVASAIYVARADGKSPLTQLYETSDADVQYLDWSPDGSTVAFTTSNDDNKVSMNLVGRSGGKPQEVFRGSNAAWDWSPDSKTILAQTNQTGRAADARLRMFDVDTGAAANLVGDDQPAFRSPQYSADGNFMLLTRPADGRNSIVLANPDGLALRELGTVSGRIAFAWSPLPGDSRVAYIVIPPGQPQRAGALHLLDTQTGQDTVLSQLPVSAFYWSPDGVRLAAISPMRASDITQDFPGLDLTPENPTNVLMMHMIDTNTRNDRQLFFFEPTPEFQTQLSQFDQFGRASTIWSPDGFRVVFPLAYNDGQTTRNFIIESEASGSINPRILGNGTMAVWSPK